VEEVKQQFAESYARTRKRLTQSEWALRFRVSRRTICNWLADVEVKGLIARIRKSPNAVVSREFVESLTAEERATLAGLLEQQERIEADPWSGLTLDELRGRIVRKAFGCDTEELSMMTQYFTDLAGVFTAIEESFRQTVQSHPHEPLEGRGIRSPE
jgi:DNA-binding MarR family transcriptional regulator